MSGRESVVTRLRGNIIGTPNCYWVRAVNLKLFYVLQMRLEQDGRGPVLAVKLMRVIPRNEQIIMFAVYRERSKTLPLLVQVRDAGQPSQQDFRAET